MLNRRRRLQRHEKMDPEAFLDLANHVAKLKMHPYFELAHCVACCLAIKEDMGSGKRPSSSGSGEEPLAALGIRIDCF